MSQFESDRMNMAALKLVEITRFGTPAAGAPPAGKTARDLMLLMSAVYAREGYVAPWVGYLAQMQQNYVGMCAFKSPPVSNRVEIALNTFPEYEGCGIATQMTVELVALARQTEPAVIITAQTLPEKNASTILLERCGFALHGEVQHPEDGTLWEWRYTG